MNTAEFLNALRARPDLPLAFSTTAGPVPSGFHLTEVKRVVHETVDCGSVAHNWTENHFELWTPASAEPDRAPMPAGKFLSIVGKVRRFLTLDEKVEARVFGRASGGSDQLHSIESIETGSDSIRIHLEPVSASCKARDRRDASARALAVCCGADGSSSAPACCGSASPTAGEPMKKKATATRAGDTWFRPFESPGFRFMI